MCCIISKDLLYCLSFIFCAWLSVISAALAVLQTPFYKKAPNRQFLGFSLAINVLAKVVVMCLDNTDCRSFWE